MKKRNRKNKFIAFLAVVGTALAGGFTVMHFVAKANQKATKNDADLSQDTYEDEGQSKLYQKSTFYENTIKPAGDKLLSFCALVTLAPIFGLVSLAIYLDDPGPILFTQKRVGLNKKYFKIHKFRSMKTSTPKNMPTHMLSNPDQYITKVGKFIRKYSLDELPQIWDIFVGNMSIIGPRPALWNQSDLIAERDKYGANDVKPGLTGWAQINGRDELEIDVKAKLDGDYVKKLKKNNIAGFVMDVKCLFGTVSSVLKSEGVVEGGTGEMKKEERNGLPDIAEIDEDIELDYSEYKRILIAGAGSYIGESFREYMSQWDNYEIDAIDTMDDSWLDEDFSKYDVVYDVAGIAHVKETDVNRQLYYDVNRDLAVELAQKAKAEGVKQFIYLSSMSVYGLTVGRIDKDTPINPVNAYGKSKLEAEIKLWEMNDENFVISIVRPPMVYGNGCKGNYQLLRKFALKVGVFPDYENERSMIFIDNLSSAIRGIVHNCACGIYFPQNIDYVCTKEMISQIANIHDKKIIKIKYIDFFLTKINMALVNKVFGNLIYDDMNVPEEWIVQKDFAQTMILSEKEVRKDLEYQKKKVLVMMSAYNGEKYIEQQIESIMHQKGLSDVKLLIRDDGSSDMTCFLIEKMMSKYPQKIELIRGTNLGYNKSFFYLFNAANGYDYYAISDQDDVWQEDKLKIAVSMLENQNENGPMLYASTSFLVDENLHIYGCTRKMEREISFYNTIVQNICPGHTQVFNNALLELLKQEIDYDRIYVYDSWITNMSVIYGKIIFDNESHTLYRQHRGNQLGSGSGVLGHIYASLKRTINGDGKKYREQIKYFSELNITVLKERDYYDEIDKFISANDFIPRLRYVLNSRLYRQKNIETVALYMAILFGKY